MVNLKSKGFSIRLITNAFGSVRSIKGKPIFRFSTKNQRKISKVVCFALEDVRDMQNRLGIGGSGSVVEDRPVQSDIRYFDIGYKPRDVGNYNALGIHPWL